MCGALDCDSFQIVNLYAAVLPSAGALDTATCTLGWADGRLEIERAVRETSTKAILLGYGVRAPVGPQRVRHREQLRWLAELLALSGHEPWTYGDRPSHPSRWQRVAHRHRPGSSVYDLAFELLQQHKVGNVPLGSRSA